jgi:serine/threonine protein kinase
MEPSEKPGVTIQVAEITESPDNVVFENDYIIKKTLRSGSFGVVSITEHKKTNENFAVKAINRKKLNERDEVATFREINIMKDLMDVNNVVQLVDVYVSPSTFYIVQTLAKGGDVFDRLAQRNSYSEMDARALSIELMKTMKELHKRKVCHRDMKPENILLRSPDDDSSILLADFGFAKYVPDDGLKTRCGTPAFVAPEIINKRAYSTSADMWSVGCLIYMLIGGYPPFQDTTHRGLFRKIRGSNFTFHSTHWKNVSLQSKQLITNLLTVDPEERLEAAKSLSMPWFRQRDDELSSRDLSSSIGEFKKFNAGRTFKSAVNKVMAVNEIASITKAFRVNKIEDLMDTTDIPVDEDQESAVSSTYTKLNLSHAKTKKFSELYEVRGKIHRGSAGVVSICYSKFRKMEFAVKVIARDDDTDEHVLHEVNIMNQLDHENIVAVVDYFEEDDFYYIVMELMAGGDVFDRILDLQNYTEKDARDLARTLLSAVDYMHDSGVAHRDIKPQNIFLETKESNSAIKVGDFGFAKRVHTPMSLISRCGTPSYVAPEILKNQPYDQSCDMWSVGVVLYVMLCGYTPFMEEKQNMMFERIKMGDWTFDPEDWSGISTEAKDLIKGLMCTSPHRRLTAKQALRSKWIAGVSAKSLESRSLASSRNLKKDKSVRVGLTNKFKKNLSVPE